jgi:hypothetical protein
MNPPPTVFAQILAGMNQMEFARAAARFPMPRASRSLSAYDHFAAMVFAQLTYRESLRGIEACLEARRQLLYHSGIRARSSAAIWLTQTPSETGTCSRKLRRS